MQPDSPSNGGHTIVINLTGTGQPPAIHINGAPADVGSSASDSKALADVRAHLHDMYRRFRIDRTTPLTYREVGSALRHAADLAWPDGNAPY